MAKRKACLPHPPKLSRKLILGGKGQGLADMTAAGLPVPPGFTISIPCCEEYYKLGKTLSAHTKKEILENLAKVEKDMGKKLGDPNGSMAAGLGPLRYAALPMPGMMETILNPGLNDKSVEGLAAKTGNPRFAYDSYRRFIQMYSTTAMGLSKEPMEDLLHELKHKIGVKTDPEIPAEHLKTLCESFKKFYQENQGQSGNSRRIPSNNSGARSWLSLAVGKPTRPSRIAATKNLRAQKGTGVNVQTMVYGSRGEEIRHRRLLHATVQHRRKRHLRRLPHQRPGRRCRCTAIRTPLKLSTLGDTARAAIRN